MWLLPTYGRPAQCAEMLATLTAKSCSTSGIVFVNGCDHDAYRAALELPSGWEAVYHPENLGLCGAMRWCFREFPDEPFYGQITDDEFVQTNGWDKTLIDAAGRWCLAYGKNHVKSSKLPHGFMTFGGDLVRAVGWWEPEGLWHWYSEAFWDVICRRLDLLRQCPEVSIEERFHTTGKTAYDETYRLGESRKNEDQDLFLCWLRDPSEYGMIKTCERVKKAMEHG